ncbi:MAG: DUF1667 domain-containing protein [Lachnospiraceae bacterium]|nr:DUF1667 domain-containing protein [Lachnospiraceae bacterium]
MKSELTCIVCPMSCQITVEQDEITKEINSVAGNTCKRGDMYARNELTHPMRQLTSTVAIQNAPYKRLPVILSAEIPKEQIFSVMEQIHKVNVCAPVKKGDVIIENVCELNVDVVASRSMGTTYES